MQSNIIRDRKTGDSLNYAFIEFETQEAAEVAYEKMDNVIIDDRRIKVDFSQSAHHQWRQFNLGRREKQIEKRRSLAKDIARNGPGAGPTGSNAQVLRADLDGCLNLSLFAVIVCVHAGASYACARRHDASMLERRTSGRVCVALQSALQVR